MENLENNKLIAEFMGTPEWTKLTQKLAEYQNKSHPKPQKKFQRNLRPQKSAIWRFF